MRHVRSYKELFESQTELTPEQIEWLNACIAGRWELNPQTGLVDVKGNFDCTNKGLTNLRGIRFGEVSGYFACSENSLTSLEGAPQIVVGGFSCAGNQLTTLEGAPESVGRGFICDYNQLTSLEGAPKTVDGNFYCSDNPVSEKTLKAIFKLMRKGMGYQQALEEYWPNMGEEDRVLVYKQMPNLPLEDARTYKALATYANIKGYL
jgi:hypothetical protein